VDFLLPAIDLKGNILEARVGIEPTNKGFADLGLTTWLPRLTEGRTIWNIARYGARSQCRPVFRAVE
jgi:hypothetical protein